MRGEGLIVAQLSGEKVEKLKKTFPGYFTVSNPLDLTGSATDEWYGDAFRETLSGDDFDIAIVAALWGPPALTDELPAILAETAKKSGKPVIICSPGGEYAKTKKRLFEELGLPVFQRPRERCARPRLFQGPADGLSELISRCSAHGTKQIETLRVKGSALADGNLLP